MCRSRHGIRCGRRPGGRAAGEPPPSPVRGAHADAPRGTSRAAAPRSAPRPRRARGRRGSQIHGGRVHPDREARHTPRQDASSPCRLGARATSAPGGGAGPPGSPQDALPDRVLPDARILPRNPGPVRAGPVEALQGNWNSLTKGESFMIPRILIGSLAAVAVLGTAALPVAAQDVTAEVRTWSGLSLRLSRPSLEVFYTILPKEEGPGGGPSAGRGR